MMEIGIHLSNLILSKMASIIKIILLFYFSFNSFTSKETRKKLYYCGNSYWCSSSDEIKTKELNRDNDRIKNSYASLLGLKNFIFDKNVDCLDNLLKLHSLHSKENIKLKIKYYNGILKRELEKNGFASYADIFNEYDLDATNNSSIYKFVLYCRKSLRHELKKVGLIYLTDDLKYINPKEKYMISESIFMI